MLSVIEKSVFTKTDEGKKLNTTTVGRVVLLLLLQVRTAETRTTL